MSESGAVQPGRASDEIAELPTRVRHMVLGLQEDNRIYTAREVANGLYGGTSLVRVTGEELSKLADGAEKELIRCVEECLLVLEDGGYRYAKVGEEQLRVALKLRLCLEGFFACELQKHLPPRDRADHQSPRQLDELRQRAEEVRDKEHRADIITADWAFHESLAKLAGYEVAVPFVKQLFHKTIRGAPGHLDPTRARAVAGEHLAIIKEIEFGNSANIDQAVRDHLTRAGEITLPDPELGHHFRVV